MRVLRAVWSALLLLNLLAPVLQAQVTTQPAARPWGVGTTLPATCTVGSLFFKTDALVPGQNLYECASANNWTQQVASVAPAGSQSPWTQNIDGGGFSLSNVTSVAVTGTGAGTVSLGNATNSNVTGFQGSVVAADLIYTMPTADGTSGQVLSTNGSKVLSWATAAGGAFNFTAASRLGGRGSASGAGAQQEITLGTNLSMSGTTLNATAGAGGYATVLEEGSGLTPRTSLNFIGTGITCADNAGSSRTDCTVTTGGGAGTVTNTGGALTLDQPLFGAGGVDSKVGTKSGNTTTVVTTTGAQTSGRCVQIDSFGNHVQAAAGCGGAAATLDGARVYNSTDIPTTSGTPLKLTFNSERFDNGGLHATNDSKFVIVKTGQYMICVNVVFAANSTGNRYADVVLNGTDFILDTTRLANATGVTTINGCTITRLVATDFVELEVAQTGGSIMVNATPMYSPEFSIQLLTQ